MGCWGAALQPARGAVAQPGALGCEREPGSASPAFHILIIKLSF